jgi:tryptophanyl-tRNA synthetase
MKKRVITALTPSSDQLHIGNYFGAIKQMIDLQNNEDYEVLMFISSLHAFTKVQDAAQLRHNISMFVKIYLACGVDPERIFMFDQAPIAWHTQLTWILSCMTHMWFMQRMHVYKDAAAKWTADALNVWMFCYPILMAADILLYDIDLVPVGQDQKQHVEYARDIAEKFNRQFGDVFVLPDALIQSEVAVVPGIDGRKMSKSYDNFLWLLDTPEVLKKKVKLIVTDALPIEAVKNPDTCNVYNILKLFLSPEEDIIVRKRYTDWGLGYGVIKEELYQKVVEFVAPIQHRFSQLDDTMIEQMLLANGQKANDIASKKIEQVYKAVGLL